LNDKEVELATIIRVRVQNMASSQGKIMHQEIFKYDVFISYSSANKTWVRSDLLLNLEKAGLKVSIDFRDFEVGKPALINMRDCILASKHTLLVLTEHYLNSAWAEFENLLSQTIDPANRRRRIIPLLKEKCELPIEIGYLTYVNFYNPENWDISWHQLLTSLGDTSDTNNIKNITHPAIAEKTANKPIKIQPQQIADAFYECSTFRDREVREIIVNRLAPAIIGIRRNNIDKVDIFNIVSRCMEFANGIDNLTNLLESFEGPSIAMKKIKTLTSSL
jgi:hypothetical protein